MSGGEASGEVSGGDAAGEVSGGDGGESDGEVDGGEAGEEEAGGVESGSETGGEDDPEDRPPEATTFKPDDDFHSDDDDCSPLEYQYAQQPGLRCRVCKELYLWHIDSVGMKWRRCPTPQEVATGEARHRHGRRE